jgi:hypothetical protein
MFGQHGYQGRHGGVIGGLHGGYPGSIGAEEESQASFLDHNPFPDLIRRLLQ